MASKTQAENLFHRYYKYCQLFIAPKTNQQKTSITTQQLKTIHIYHHSLYGSEIQEQLSWMMLRVNHEFAVRLLAWTTVIYSMTRARGSTSKVNLISLLAGGLSSVGIVGGKTHFFPTQCCWNVLRIGPQLTQRAGDLREDKEETQ